MQSLVPSLFAAVLLALSASPVFAAAPSQDTPSVLANSNLDSSADVARDRQKKSRAGGNVPQAATTQKAPKALRSTRAPVTPQAPKATTPGATPSRPPVAQSTLRVPKSGNVRQSQNYSIFRKGGSNVPTHEAERGKQTPARGNRDVLNRRPAHEPGVDRGKRPDSPTTRDPASGHRPGSHSPARGHHGARHHYRAGRYGPPLHGHPVWYRPSWSYGVFYYPVSTRTEVVYVDGVATTSEATVAEQPERSIDRAGAFSVGLRGGSYLSGYRDGPGYGDFGMGFAARYRAAEALGFEVGWQYHDDSWTKETERISQPLSVSAQLFAFPWTRFNPYVFAGVTWTDRNYHDPISVGPNAGLVVNAQDKLFGPQGGVGIEIGVGDNASVNLETRFIGYLNKDPEDLSRAGALQANLGFNFYF